MQTFRAYLQLVRLPAVFTALADVVLGFLLTHDSLFLDGCPLPFALLLLSSAGLYLGGMALNDIFDRAVDAVERPGRPIPSGRVSLKAAVLVAAVLLIGGIVAAACVGSSSLVIAACLAAAIFAYDSGVKRTLPGPVVMGLCRSLNVLMACSAGLAINEIFGEPQLLIAGAYGIYIAGLTWFAREEAGTSRRSHLAAAAVAINLGLLALLALAINTEMGLGSRGVAWTRVAFGWGMVALVINRGVWMAVSQPTPQLVQRAVRTMLQWIIVLDAVMIFATGAEPIVALATAALLIPTLLIGRWLYVT